MNVIVKWILYCTIVTIITSNNLCGRIMYRVGRKITPDIDINNIMVSTIGRDHYIININIGCYLPTHSVQGYFYYYRSPFTRGPLDFVLVFNFIGDSPIKLKASSAPIGGYHTVLFSIKLNLNDEKSFGRMNSEKTGIKVLV